MSDLELIASLQRELAEARAERDKWRAEFRDYFHNEDAVIFIVSTELFKAACPEEMPPEAPGPSDAKGEPESQLNTNTDQIGMKPSLTPLTDESVRGVLVDDGVKHIGVDRFYVGPDCQLEFDRCGGSSVKLRPASEFGVPAESQPTKVGDVVDGATTLAHVELWNKTTGELFRDSDGELGIIDAEYSIIFSAAGEQQLREFFAKSTPAVPAQKLVKLPEGVHVFDTVLDRPKRGDLWRNLEQDDWRVADHDWGPAMPRLQVLRRVDPTLYGVDAERVRELEAQNKQLCADLERVADERDRLASVPDLRPEVERLRKAIETHKRLSDLKCLNSYSERDKALYDALTPPTAASGENAAPHEGKEPNVPAFFRMLQDDDSQPPSAPAAESGEGFVKAVFRKASDAREYVILSARLAACEERCRELEAGIEAHESETRRSLTKAGQMTPWQTDVELWSLLAPKAGGETQA